MGRAKRTSLSDWYARPDEACSESLEVLAEDSDSLSKRFSPSKRRSSNDQYFIGDDSSRDCSREASPKKRAAKGTEAIGGVESGNVNAATMIALRGICADYFENNVSPILKYVQQTQEQLVSQLAELSAKVEHKADALDVTPLAEIEQVAARAAISREDSSKVAFHVRMEEIATAMNQKANANSVPTLAQLGLKANTKDQTELESRVRAAEKKVANLGQELRDLRKMDTSGASSDPADIAKVKAVFAAAGLRVDRQLKEMRHQVQKLREDCVGKEVGDRWPGRKIETGSVTSARSLRSDNESLDRFSLGASATPSSTLEPEERAELKKFRTMVSAAGTIFSRDLTEVKKQMRDARAELHAVKDALSTSKAISTQ
jgi:hypothetical protein